MSNPYRAELPDGTRLERDYKLDDAGRSVPYGSWYWRVYDPDRRPNRRDHVTEAGAILRQLNAAGVLSGQPSAWLRDWVVFGLGPGEQAALRWSDVRLAEGAVRVRGTKTAGSSPRAGAYWQ